MPWDSISWIPLLLGAYIIGSFPTAYLAGHFLKKVDIREMGDKNAGAANVYRNLGHNAGISVGVIDIAKGALVVLIARVLMDGTTPLMVAGLAGIAGHNWPFYLHFRGGRGAATAMGVLIAFVPIPAIPMSLGALVVLKFTRNAVAALGFAFIPLPLLTWLTGASLIAVSYTILLPIVVGFSHFTSVRRLPQLRETAPTSPLTHTPKRH